MNLGHLIAEGGRHTLIVTRRWLTEPKTALAGAILERSSARSKSLTALFSLFSGEVSIFPCFLLDTIVKIQGGHEKVVRRAAVRSPRQSPAIDQQMNFLGSRKALILAPDSG